ncbi:MAG: FAD-dependent oxidoreductase [Coprothermobacterota bacterium]|nr:FAD-dependent oxidoreductase [Coprothermobacterota bacterium]
MRCLIVGNGAAGVNVAKALREKLPELEIVVLTREDDPYYPRPMLVELLAGAVSEEQLPFYSSPWYQQRRIEVRARTTVEGVDPAAKTVRLRDGVPLAYDQLVLASGCNAFLPPIENNQLPGVFTLRTLADARAIRRWMADSQQAVIVGGGFLGLEAAHSLKRAGLERVVALETSSRLLPRQLDEEGAALLQRLLAEMGVEVWLNASSQAFFGSGKLAGLALADGRRVAAEMALVSTGVRPEVSYLEGSGVETKRGVVVDDHCRTNQPDVYAAGDVAEWRGQLWGIIPAALAQAPVVAAQIAGEDLLFSGIVPSNTLKVVGVDLAIFGEANPQDPDCQQVRVEDPEGRSYVKMVLRDHRVVGAIALNKRKLQAKLAQLVSQRAEMEPGEAERLLEN